MELTLKRQVEAINNEGVSVWLWKFVDENGDLWNTETSIEGTEEEAKQIILNSLPSND